MCGWNTKTPNGIVEREEGSEKERRESVGEKKRVRKRGEREREGDSNRGEERGAGGGNHRTFVCIQMFYRIFFFLAVETGKDLRAR